LLGFHSHSVFRADSKDVDGKELYDPSDLAARKGPYLSPESADAVRLVEMYSEGGTGAFPEDALVLCDVYARRRKGGAKVGMPILYYKADILKTANDVNNPDNPGNIFDYKDNHELLGLGVPGKGQKKHPLYVRPAILYEMLRQTRGVDRTAPYNADSFILISAGRDGLYGTEDDVTNFGEYPMN